jgi:hypothetical protein
VKSIDEMLTQTGTTTLEAAFIVLTGCMDERELLEWREQKGTPA